MIEKDNRLILVVDDCQMTLKAIQEILKEYGHKTLSCTNSEDALDMVSQNNIDVVLSDINMPGMSGIKLLEHIHPLGLDIPVILMTGYADLNTAVSAINGGAFNFILKPFAPSYFIEVIRKALDYKRLRNIEKDYKDTLEKEVKLSTEELTSTLRQIENISREIVHRFTRLAEYRDTDTGNHISRIGIYSMKLAEALNMPDSFVRNVSYACPLHDIGKFGIPDNILLKPGSLTEREFDIIKMHTVIGKKILENSLQPTIQMAESIAWTHHERWDGSGYPRGIKGNEIPLEGMIAMIADQYDALRSKRPYKDELAHDEVFQIMTEGDERTKPDHFGPHVLRAFIEVAPALNEIFESTRESHSASNNIPYHDLLFNSLNE